MTDAELIARLRDSKGWPTLGKAAADRIEALIAERDALFRRATLAEEWRDHDKTRAEAAEAKLAENEVRLGKAVEALEGLIQQTYDCEKELTEGLHHEDFCGESEPLTNARAALAELKGESQ